MTTEALLYIARGLERLAADPDGIWKDEVLRLAKFAKAEAGVPQPAEQAPKMESIVSISKLKKGDVVFRHWGQDGVPPLNDVYQVLKVSRRAHLVSVLSVDGQQLTFKPWDVSYFMPREQAKRLSIPWRFRITW